MSGHPGRERTLFILLILEKHIISLLLWLYRNKSRQVDPLQFQIIFLAVRSKLTRVFLVLFTVIKKRPDSPHRCRLRPQGKPIRDRVGWVHPCHCQQGKKTLQVTWHRWLADPMTTPPNFLFFFFNRSTRFTWMTYFKVKTANFPERWQVCTPGFITVPPWNYAKRFVLRGYWNTSEADLHKR